MSTSFSLNGKSTTLDADPNMPLLWAVREVAGLTGTKFGCGMALCGACTVHLDGKAIRSLRYNAVDRGRPQGHDHRGLGRKACQGSAGSVGQTTSAPMRLLPIGSNHVRDGSARIEFCAERCDIDSAMSGNICRCATYSRIRAAIHAAADTIKV